MKNKYFYQLLFSCFLAAFFVPKNTYATTIRYDLRKSAVKDTTNYDYRLSEEEEEEILDEIQQIRRRNNTAIILYAVSFITIGITGIPAAFNSIRTLIAIQKLQKRLENYPEDDLLAQKLQRVSNTNLVALCIGAFYAALFFYFILEIGAALSGASLNAGAVFGGTLAAFLYLIFEFVFFRTNNF